MTSASFLLLAACDALPTIVPSPSSPDTSFFRPGEPRSAGAMLLAVELPDGDTTLLVSNGTQGLGPQGYGEVHRLDREDDGWSDALLARHDGGFPYDLGVLDSLRLGHDAPIVYALGQAFDLRDGTVVPYDAPIDDDTAPTPCGDVDGDGRSDRCHAHTVLFANGETATFIDRWITGFGRGVEPALFAGCVHRDVSPGLHAPDSGDCGWLAGQHQTAHDRDVDGDGQDDFSAGNTLRNWHNEVLARLDSDGGATSPTSTATATSTSYRRDDPTPTTDSAGSPSTGARWMGT